MDSQADSQDFEKTVNGDDFDFDFDEDFESETASEYTVMDAMRFDRQAGTASCNFEIDEDEDDGFGSSLNKTGEARQPEPEKNGKADKKTKAAASKNGTAGGKAGKSGKSSK